MFVFTKKMKAILYFVFITNLFGVTFYMLDLDEVEIAKQNFKHTRNLSKLVQTKKLMIANTKISINSAGKEELVLIPGVGVKTAEKIMLYRIKNPFKTLKDLINIKGIGPKKFEKMKKFICL